VNVNNVVRRNTKETGNNGHQQGSPPYLRNMKRSTLIIPITLILIFLSTKIIVAQSDYRTAIGLRLNGGAGLTVRHFLKNDCSLEGILYTRWGGVNITGLYQISYPVFNEPGFNFYFGGGGHIGFWDRSATPWWNDDRYNDTRMVIGIDGQLGIEYTFQNIPLNLSLDWKPAINLVGITNFWGSDVGLSVRYAIR
jgi:hypothetical protein